jgi:hypothetical protein
LEISKQTQTCLQLLQRIEGHSRLTLPIHRPHEDERESFERDDVTIESPPSNSNLAPSFPTVKYEQIPAITRYPVDRDVQILICMRSP